MNDRLSRMLGAQLNLQIEAGMNPIEMSVEQVIEYIKTMTLAATDELHEALNEIGWKTWATSRHINSVAAFSELRDAWQFLTNLMFAVTGEDDPENLADMLESSLYKKIALNQARILEMYTGLDKCGGCRRSLDEVSIHEVHISPRLIKRLCGACGAMLPNAVVSAV
jgi:hypothetical protein